MDDKEWATRAVFKMLARCCDGIAKQYALLALLARGDMDRRNP